jgi:hypothetical protein
MKISCNFQVRTADSCATVWTGLWRRLDAPQCLEASVLQLSGQPSYTVQKLGQATLSSTRSWISDDTIWEGFARRLEYVATRLDATQCSRIFRVSFTDAKMSDSIDRSDARSSRPNMVLFWEEYYHSRKAVANDHPDATRQSPKLNRIRFSVSL